MMLRLSHQFMGSVGAAAIGGLLSLSMANAQSVSDNTALSYWAADVFAKSLRDQTAISDQTSWSDISALSYAKSGRSAPPTATWLPQPMPAVDGINAKIDGYGGANHTNGFYGTTGSLAVPLAQQWGAQIDGRVENADGIGAYGVAGHLFWRDPSIGLVGAYGSYWHWNGRDVADIGHLSANTSTIAAEGEYYSGRWTLSGLAGIEMVSIDAPVALDASSIPNRFFDSIRASYYVTDNFKLSIGHVYSSGRHGLTLGAEHGFALGGGRMASLFAAALFAEEGHNVVHGGLRIYFGQHDKTLIDRHRQDDPAAFAGLGSPDHQEPCGLPGLVPEKDVCKPPSHPH
jgi:hypothetical protein